MRILGMIQPALIEAGTVLFQKPDGHICGCALRNRNDNVGEIRPRVIQVVLRWPRRMIRMRMVEPEQLSAELSGLPLGFAVIGRSNEKPSSRSFLGCVVQR